MTLRCNHCGRPVESREHAATGECPHCGDAYPYRETHEDHAVRCDGCGATRSERHCETFEDGDTNLGTYCGGCRDVLDLHGIDPRDHERYRLLEGIDA